MTHSSVKAEKILKAGKMYRVSKSTPSKPKRVPLSFLKRTFTAPEHDWNGIMAAHEGDILVYLGKALFKNGRSYHMFLLPTGVVGYRSNEVLQLDMLEPVALEDTVTQ